MKQIYSLLAVVAATFTMNAQDAFPGADFENFATFQAGLNSYGLQSYAVQGQGQGVNGSNSLSISTTPSKNDYVFTAKTPAGLPSDITAITFMIKGTSPSKSISLNVYKTDGTSYYKFNAGDLTTDVTLTAVGSNQYTGSINTNGNWTKVTLDLSSISDYNMTAGTEKFFSLKVGKQSAFDIDLDDFKLVSATLGTIDLELTNSASFIKNTIVKEELNFAAKSDVQVFDMNGKVVKSAFVSENKSLNLNDLPKGMYIVTGLVNGKKVSEKIIKK